MTIAPSPRRRPMLLGLLLVLSHSLALSADNDPPPRVRDARSQRELQQQIREQARSLLTQVIDIQLQNLEENRLQDLPVYGELRSMQADIDDLIDGEMKKVVELLEQRNASPGESNVDTRAQVRQISREIVSRLSVERQRIARRLKTVEIRTGIERLVTAQAQAARQSAALAELPIDRQESQLSSAIETQRDVKQQFQNFEAALRESRQWRNEAGNDATAALKEFDQSGTAQDVERAIAALENLQTEQAAAVQERLLQSFRKIASGLAPPASSIQNGHSSSGPQDAVRQLHDSQATLRDKTRELTSDSPEIDDLVQSQTEMRQQLGELARQFTDGSSARSALEEAQAAAESARQSIFEGDREQALKDQEAILGLLDRAAQESAEPEVQNQSQQRAQSARQLADSLRSLEEAARELQGINDRQAQVRRQAPSDPDAASKMEQQIAAKLASAAKKTASETLVTAGLEEARDAVNAAAKALQTPSDKEGVRQGLDRAEREVEQAAAALQAALNDARRRAMAVKAGELSRAAESLDRAAGAQRDVAEATHDAARAGQLPESQGAALRERQRQIRGVSEGIAAAVAESGSAGAEEAREADKAVAETEQRLSEATADQERTSEKALNEVADRANAAADHLTRAAASLRNEVKSIADELSQEASRQAEQISAARESVERELSAAPRAISEEMQALAAARSKVREARAEQDRASGRPRAARMQELEQALHDSLDRQIAANRAGERAASDRSKHSDAVEAQRTSNRQMQDLASRLRAADPSLREAAGELEQAVRAGERVTQAMVEGTGRSPAEDREAAVGAMQRSLAAVEAQSREAAAQPPGQLDPAAQERASRSISESRKAATLPPDIERRLTQAEQASKRAEDGLRGKDQASAGTAQQEAAKALAEADSQLNELMRRNASNQSQQLADDRQRARRLAEPSAADPEALSAMRDAERTAGEAAADPRESSHAQREARSLMQQAAESLSAREQQVRRDESAARSMADLAARQQSAAAEIQASRRDLTQNRQDDTENENEDPPPPTATSQEDQQALAESSRRMAAATEEFVRAQRGTGRRAEEIAGYSQIASSPLQKALEMASRLGAATQGAQLGAESEENNSSDAEGGPGARQGPGGAEMGSGFVPSSPEATARMLAGAAALGQGTQAGGGSQPGADGQGSESPGSGQSESSGGADSGPPPNGSDSAGGNPGESGSSGQSGNSGSSGTATASEAGSRQGADALDSSTPVARDESWLLKLPPETRRAIRARARRPPPRAYESRLKRYFESLK